MLEALIENVRLVSESLEGTLMQDLFVDNPNIGQMMCDMQREQLMDGMRSDGTQIQPSFDRDPFFKKDMSPVKYAQRKYQQFGPSRRDFMTPNLNITGFFHSGFHACFWSDSIFMDNYNRNVPNAGYRGSTDLYAKYGEDTFGLTDENWNHVLDIMRPMLLNRIKERL